MKPITTNWYSCKSFLYKKKIICTSQHPALQKLRLFPWKISSSACIPKKNWKCASKAGTSGNFTEESCTDAVGFKPFQNYVRIHMKWAFFVVQISLVFYYLSICTRASLFLSALVRRRKQGITKIDFVSGSKAILIPGVSAGQFHPEAVGSHVDDTRKWYM